MRRLAVIALLLLPTACGPTGVRVAIDDAVLLDPEAALASADAAFADWLDQIPSSHDDPRCYFEALPHDGREDDHLVGHEAWCGPALTLDHEERFPWSIGEFITEPDAGGRLHVRATSDFRPAEASPRELLLADGTQVPDVEARLDYPEPPPLDPSHSERLTATYSIGVEAQEASAAVVALHNGQGGVTEVTLSAGLTDSLGKARTRRVAPEGHQLLLLNVRSAGRLPMDSVIAQLEVAGESYDLDVERPLDDGQVLVVVPEDASLAFTVLQRGVEQRLDLRTGDVDRDARAQHALDVGVRRHQLPVVIDAGWTETTVYEDFLGNVYTYDGLTYWLTGRCDTATVSPFDRDWTPEGTLSVEVSCTEVATDFGADLTPRALELSGRLQVLGTTLEPVDVDVTGSGTWPGEVTVRYRFEAPVTATEATFVFQGHADIPGDGLQAFSPPASARIDFDGGED